MIMSINKTVRYPKITQINGIKITSKEVDIIACILNGRSTKTIASFLSISPKTVETHLRNIMQKLGCHSRESIINFFENTVYLCQLRHHYLGLRTQLVFNQHLQQIAILARQ